jgi:hypothetical protein
MSRLSPSGSDAYVASFFQNLLPLTPLQVNVVTRPIEAVLLSFGQVLYVSIANMPVAWLQFATRIHSRTIYHEALIHAVGQYFINSVQTQLPSLEAGLAAILQKKAFSLKDGIKEAFRGILGYYPEHIQRSVGVGRADIDNFGRSSYSNDIFDWMALTVVRHWLAGQIAEDQTHQAADLGKSVIDTIMLGGNEFLAKRHLTEWHKCFPLSGKASNVLQHKIEQLKEMYKSFIQVRKAFYAGLEHTC